MATGKKVAGFYVTLALFLKCARYPFPRMCRMGTVLFYRISLGFFTLAQNFLFYLEYTDK
jgi:hypothetical protein